MSDNNNTPTNFKLMSSYNGNGTSNGQVYQTILPSQEHVMQEDEIDIRPILYRWLRNWYWIILSTLFFAGLGWTYLRYATEIYNVEGSLLIRSDDRSGMTQEDILFAEIGFGTKNNLENELQILKSFPVLSEVIDTLDLNVSYFDKGRIKSTDIYTDSPIKATILSEENTYSKKTESTSLTLLPLNSERFQLLEGEEDTVFANYNTPFSIGDTTLIINWKEHFEAPIEIVFHDRTEQIKDYLEKLKINIVDDSDVLKVSMEDAVPQRAVDFIQQLIRVYNKSIVQEKKQVAENTLDFIEERLQFITKELYDVEKQAESYRKRNEVPIELSSSANYYLEEISNSDKIIGELKFQQSFVGNLKSYLVNQENAYSFLSSLPEIGESTGFSNSVQQYNDLLANREKLLLAANPANPQVVLIEEQIASLRNSVLVSLGQIEQDLQSRISQLQNKVDPILKRMNEIPRNQRELLQIMRQQQIKESLFLFLLQKREETGLTLASQIADTRIINPPTNLGMVSPNKAAVLAGSGFLGIFFALGLLTLLELFRNTIDSEEEIKQVTNAPILGHIGKSSQKEQIVVRRGQRSTLAEMFRLLRTNLQFMYPIKKDKGLKVLVTSSSSGEGKTFISINLGASMALSGEDTLLVGFDLRKPKLSKYLGEETSLKGVSNYLAGMTDDPLDLVVNVPGFDHLYYIASGPIPPDPADMIARDRTALLFEKISKRFKYIVIDCPPVGLVTDAFLLGKYADVSLYISRQGITHKGQLKIIDDIYRNKKLPRPSIVLNGVSKGKRYGYGYGYGYGEYTKEQNYTTTIGVNELFKSDKS